MVHVIMKVAWKSCTMGNGGLCVMITSIYEMQESFVECWVSPEPSPLRSKEDSVLETPVRKFGLMICGAVVTRLLLPFVHSGDGGHIIAAIMKMQVLFARRKIQVKEKIRLLLTFFFIKMVLY